MENQDLIELFEKAVNNKSIKDLSIFGFCYNKKDIGCFFRLGNNKFSMRKEDGGWWNQNVYTIRINGIESKINHQKFDYFYATLKNKNDQSDNKKNQDKINKLKKEII